MLTGSIRAGLEGKSVWRAWIGMLCVAAMLAACNDSASKLSKEEEQVLDAMMFLFSDIEDNTAGTWRREVKGRSIEFSMIGENGIGTSNYETNRKIRQSKYVRYTKRISLKEACVFDFYKTTEFSRGDSKEDFSWHEFKGITQTLNLANAHVFKLNLEDARLIAAVIELAGPRVVCESNGETDDCENAWNSDPFSGKVADMAEGRFHGGDAENYRRLRAMELIKKACPGKPY